VLKGQGAASPLLILHDSAISGSTAKEHFGGRFYVFTTSSVKKNATWPHLFERKLKDGGFLSRTVSEGESFNAFIECPSQRSLGLE
jgi:hypothetical protein